MREHPHKELKWRRTATSIEIRAGGGLDSRRLLVWLTRGSWNFESAASSRIAAVCHSLPQRLQCPPNLFAQDKEPLLDGPAIEAIRNGWSVLYCSVLRVHAFVKKGGIDKWRGRWPKVPPRLEEIKEATEIRYEKGVFKVIHMLEKEASQSGDIFHLAVLFTRDFFWQSHALDALDGSRSEHAMLCGI